jgi:thiol-disulfide isomerase/thioredoxin
MKKIFSMALSLALLLTVSVVSSFAMTKTSASGSKAVAAKKKVTVVIIKAEWCSACQQVEPVMMGLMQEYGSKINFVVLDVTNDETTAQAMAKANSMGFGKFFAANKKMTSTVAVFKGSKQVFKTAKNSNRSDYVAAFDKALK